jgi:hypothetical protein
MILKTLTKKFINEILLEYAHQEGNELNENIFKLFQTFNNEKDKFNVVIKVAALNKIYSTAITNINPVVEKIVISSIANTQLKTTSDYVDFVDKISLVEWTNTEGQSFKRNHLSFSSKYVHFLSEYETPIYDSYIWILIQGYMGLKGNKKIIFKNPANFKEFYDTFLIFKSTFRLEDYSNYQIDKFLWQYGKMLIQAIQKELSITLEQSKSVLKKRINASR